MHLLWVDIVEGEEEQFFMLDNVKLIGTIKLVHEIYELGGLGCFRVKRVNVVYKDKQKQRQRHKTSLISSIEMAESSNSILREYQLKFMSYSLSLYVPALYFPRVTRSIATVRVR